MPYYRFHVTAEPDEDPPPLETLPTIAAESPAAAVDKLADQGRLPIAGDRLYVRLVCDDAAFLLPLAPDYEVPLDWQPED